MRKVLRWILGILIIALAVFFAQRIISSRKKPVAKAEKVVKTVFVDKVQNTKVPIVVPANGNLVAKRRMELYAEVQGIFVPGRKLFRAGQSYNRNEVLLKLDATEYRASVQSAKSGLYNLITSVMPDIRLDYPDTYGKWQNYLANFDLNKTTPKLPEYTSEQEKYFISGRDIESSYYNVKNLEEKLFKYTITSPFNGVLSVASVTEGTLVRTGQKLGEFIDPSVYELEVAISSRYADLLKEGEKVTLNNLSGDNFYSGIVTRVNSIVDKETQTVTAYIEVKDESLREGMFLEAQLEAGNEDNAIKIARNLLVEENKLFAVKDSILDLIEVEPVYFSAEDVIVKGVPEGSLILNKPVSGAYAGMAVKVFSEN